MSEANAKLTDVYSTTKRAWMQPVFDANSPQIQFKLTLNRGFPVYYI